ALRGDTRKRDRGQGDAARSPAHVCEAQLPGRRQARSAPAIAGPCLHSNDGAVSGRSAGHTGCALRLPETGSDVGVTARSKVDHVLKTLLKSMDGDIVNPGDLHGRVLVAIEVELCRDGNQISALVGRNLVEGVSGFGDAVHDALRELAHNLVREAVWVDIADAAELPFDPTNTTGSSIQTNVVELYRNFDRICALVGTEDAVSVVAGLGDSVPDALR